MNCLNRWFLELGPFSLIPSVFKRTRCEELSPSKLTYEFITYMILAGNQRMGNPVLQRIHLAN